MSGRRSPRSVVGEKGVQQLDQGSLLREGELVQRRLDAHVLEDLARWRWPSAVGTICSARHAGRPVLHHPAPRAERAEVWNTHGPAHIDLGGLVALTTRQNRELDQLCQAAGRTPGTPRRALTLFGATDPWNAPARVPDVIARFTCIGIHEFVIHWPRRNVRGRAGMPRPRADSHAAMNTFRHAPDGGAAPEDDRGRRTS